MASTSPIIWYTVRGSVRGLVSRHRLLSLAKESKRRDHDMCDGLGGGAYSDALIYAEHKDGTQSPVIMAHE